MYSIIVLQHIVKCTFWSIPFGNWGNIDYYVFKYIYNTINTMMNTNTCIYIYIYYDHTLFIYNFGYLSSFITILIIFLHYTIEFIFFNCLVPITFNHWYRIFYNNYTYIIQIWQTFYVRYILLYYYKNIIFGRNFF